MGIQRARVTPNEPLLYPAEVAALFRVDAKTVTMWARKGRIPAIRTPGGHRRYRESDVHALLAGKPLPKRDEDGNVIAS
jgi:excisionase family DNA binding protein